MKATAAFAGVEKKQLTRAWKSAGKLRVGHARPLPGDGRFGCGRGMERHLRKTTRQFKISEDPSQEGGTYGERTAKDTAAGAADQHKFDDAG